MPLPFEGQTFVLAEGRQLEELARMLEVDGATALRCPLISIVNAPDAAPVLAWIDDAITGRIDPLILMTGEALRRLLGFAERAKRRAELIAALGRMQIVTRGPKPVRALKEIGLPPSLIAAAPTTAGVIATLRTQTLQGKTAGVTLYGEPNQELEQFLTEAGAAVRTVQPYVFAPAADWERVQDVLQRMVSGEAQWIVFTSSPQVDRLFEVAEQRHLVPLLRQAFEKARVAAVGPVIAETLRQRGLRVDVCPEQGWVMKNLVEQLKREAKRPH